MKQIHLFNWFKTPAFLVLLMLVGLIFYSCSDTTSTNSTIKKAENANHFMDPGKMKRDTIRDSTNDRGDRPPPPLEGDQNPPPK